jgi:hypothetical protein
MNRWDLSHGYLLLGDAMVQTEDRTGGVQAYQQSVSLGEALLASGMAQPAADLVGAHEKLGLLAAESGDRKTALLEARSGPWQSVVRTDLSPKAVLPAPTAF